METQRQRETWNVVSNFQINRKYGINMINFTTDELIQAISRSFLNKFCNKKLQEMVYSYEKKEITKEQFFEQYDILWQFNSDMLKVIKDLSLNTKSQSGYTVTYRKQDGEPVKRWV